MTNNDLIIIQHHIRIGKGMGVTNGLPEALERLVEESQELRAINKVLETMISKKYSEYKELEDDVDGIMKTCEGMEQELERYKIAFDIACSHLATYPHVKNKFLIQAKGKLRSVRAGDSNS